MLMPQRELSDTTLRLRTHRELTDDGERELDSPDPVRCASQQLYVKTDTLEDLAQSPTRPIAARVRDISSLEAATRTEPRRRLRSEWDACNKPNLPLRCRTTKSLTPGSQ